MSSEKKIFHASDQRLSKYEVFSTLFFEMRLLTQYLWVRLILSSLFLGHEQPLGKTLAQGWRLRQAVEGGGLTSTSLSYHATVKFRTPEL